MGLETKSGRQSEIILRVERVESCESSELVSSSSLTSLLHHFFSLLVKNCISAFERDVHCLFGFFPVFARLKYLGIFPHLMRDKIAFLLLVLRRILGKRVHGVNREKWPK